MPVVVMRVPAGTPPESLPIDHWVVACDVDAYDGRGRVWLTDSVELAEPFADAAAALTYWKRISTVRPLRPDGKPNRPLSAYTIQIERV